MERHSSEVSVNPPGEATDFALDIKPKEKLVFVGKIRDEPVSAVLQVTNPTSFRQICKVKSSSNELFRIRPIMFALEPNSSLAVEVTFNRGFAVPKNQRHFLSVCYIREDDNGKGARECWQEHRGQCDGRMRVYMEFKYKGDGSDMAIFEVEAPAETGNDDVGSSVFDSGGRSGAASPADSGAGLDD